MSPHSKTSLGRARKAVPRSKKPCSNPIFESWIIEWKEEAETKDSKMKYVYAKALNSLRKYALPLSSGKECSILENFGSHMCKMIENRMANENMFPEDLQSAASQGILDVITVGDEEPGPSSKITANKKKQRTTSVKTKVPLPNVDPKNSSSELESQPSSTDGVAEPKFSKRGRLLKPRVRYSPDPDMSVTRQKYKTYRKSHYIDESTAVDEKEVAKEPEPSTAIVKMIFPSIYKVEVPSWRVNVVEDYENKQDVPIPPDDMSEVAFTKRHQKLEAMEKQRKRWDSQRQREETYRETRRMRQEERERRKELKSQPKKRKGRADYTSDEEQERLLPTLNDVKAIYISPELPFDVFEYNLPLVEKV